MDRRTSCFLQTSHTAAAEDKKVRSVDISFCCEKESFVLKISGRKCSLAFCRHSEMVDSVTSLGIAMKSSLSFINYKCCEGLLRLVEAFSLLDVWRYVNWRDVGNSAASNEVLAILPKDCVASKMRFMQNNILTDNRKKKIRRKSSHFIAPEKKLLFSSLILFSSSCISRRRLWGSSTHTSSRR